MLGYLGFAATVEADEGAGGGAGLQIFSEESELLIGRRGERLDAIQHLANRIVFHSLPGAPRVRVDAGHYRRMKDDQLVERARQLAERVRAGGRPAKTEPLNSYHRRLVHNAFVDDDGIETWSPPSGGAMKRITLRRPRR